MQERRNCREVMKCGREPGGANAGELGVCPSRKTNASVVSITERTREGSAGLLLGPCVEAKYKGFLPGKWRTVSIVVSTER